MATYTSNLNLKLPDYSDTADIKDLNDNFQKIDDAIASGGTGGGTGGGIVIETDPTVPSWAKQPNKPTYTADEVGALPATTVIPTVPSTLPNPQPIVINGISYDGSERKEITVQAGDGGSITETDPTVPAWAKAANKPTYTAEEVGALPSNYEPPIKSVNGKTGAVTLSASDVGALPSTTEIPTIPTALKNPYPLIINGVAYDGSEAKTVTIESTGGGESVSLDTTLTQYGKAADAGAVGNALAQETAAREEAVNELREANAAQDELIANKLDASELPTAINTALAQAKESGQFDGKDGAPGAKGDPGDDYVLTEADKEEIAEIAAELVEVPEGGGGSYTLPIANATTLGGVKPETKTDAMNQPVGVDANGRLYAPAAALPTDDQVGTAVDAYLTKNGVKCNDVWVDLGTITVAEGESPTQLVWNLSGAIKKFYLDGTTKGHDGSGNLSFAIRKGTGTVVKVIQTINGNWTAGTTSTIYVKAEAEEKAGGKFWSGLTGCSTFAGPPSTLRFGEENVGTNVTTISIGAHWNNQAIPVGSSFNLKVVYK